MSDKPAPDAPWLRSLDDAIRDTGCAVGDLGAALSRGDKLWLQELLEKLGLEELPLPAVLMRAFLDDPEPPELRERRRAPQQKDLSKAAKEWCRRRVRTGKDLIDREIISRVYGISTRVMNKIDSDEPIRTKGKRTTPAHLNETDSEDSGPDLSHVSADTKRLKTEPNGMTTASEDSGPDTGSDENMADELYRDPLLMNLFDERAHSIPSVKVYIDASHHGSSGFEIMVVGGTTGLELKADIKREYPDSAPLEFGLYFKHPIGDREELLDNDIVPLEPEVYLTLEVRKKAAGEVGKRGCESSSDDDDCSSIPEPSAVRDCDVSEITEAVASLLLLANPPPCPAAASDPANREAAADPISEEGNMPFKAALRASPVMDAHLSDGDSALPPDQVLTGQFKTEACEKASDKGAEEDRHGNLQRWLSQRFQSPIPTPAVNDRIDQFGGCTDPATETSTSSEHDEKKGPCLWFTISCKGKSDVPRSITTRAVSTNADLTIGSDRRMLKKISQGEMSDEINRGNHLSLLLGLSDIDLSHRHCRIFYQDGKWFVEKLGNYSASVYRYRGDERLRVKHGHPEQLCDKDHVVINKSYRLVCHMSEI